MNNSQFRDLLLSNSKHQHNAAAQSPPAATSRGPTTSTTLGSRKTSFVPMTPRHIRGTNGHSAGADFARQVAERNAAAKQQGSGKKQFKASGPRGVKLAKGYQDRALERLNAEEEEQAKDEREERIRALAEQVKDGKLEREEFEKLREEIAGGEVGSTHLVKGLDRKLLERIRKGEDVLGEGVAEGKEGAEEVDDEFEDLERKEVERVEREKKEKRGELVAPLPVAGVKRTRDDLLRELKAKRQAEMEAKQAARPELGGNFRSIEARAEKPKTIIDSKGREVIITKDEHGRVKKKVKKVVAPETNGKALPEKPIKYLDEGVTIPPPKPSPVVIEPEDTGPEAMFDDVSDDYNPLGDLKDDDDEDDPSNSEAEEDAEVKSQNPNRSSDAALVGKPNEASANTVARERPLGDELSGDKPAQPRNYFSSDRKSESDPSAIAAETNPFKDPSFLSAISRAGDLAKFRMKMESTEGLEQEDDKDAESEDDESRLERMEKEARLKKKREMLLSNSNRDMDDMDLGFGGGRFDDDEDGEDGKIKLSEWKAGGNDEDEDDGGRGGKGGGKKKRSRGKRKGDKNDAKDVLEVMKRRQGS